MVTLSPPIGESSNWPWCRLVHFRLFFAEQWLCSSFLLSLFLHWVDNSAWIKGSSKTAGVKRSSLMCAKYTMTGRMTTWKVRFTNGRRFFLNTNNNYSLKSRLMCSQSFIHFQYQLLPDVSGTGVSRSFSQWSLGEGKITPSVTSPWQGHIERNNQLDSHTHRHVGEQRKASRWRTCRLHTVRPLNSQPDEFIHFLIFLNKVKNVWSDSTSP